MPRSSARVMPAFAASFAAEFRPSQVAKRRRPPAKVAVLAARSAILGQAMRIQPTDLPDVVLVTPRIFADERGCFYESFNPQAFEDAGLPTAFVQDNVSRSKKNVLRGLHYQIDRAQGKLVRVSAGRILDVVVDLRKRAPTFGRASTFVLSSDEPQLLWIPPGFAHGFLVISEEAEVTYKVTDIYSPQHERTIIWNDPDLAIDWKTSSPPILSAKDAKGVRMSEAEVFE